MKNQLIFSSLIVLFSSASAFAGLTPMTGDTGPQLGELEPKIHQGLPTTYHEWTIRNQRGDRITVTGEVIGTTALIELDPPNPLAPGMPEVGLGISLSGLARTILGDDIWTNILELNRTAEDFNLFLGVGQEAINSFESSGGYFKLYVPDFFNLTVDRQNEIRADIVGQVTRVAGNARNYLLKIRQGLDAATQIEDIKAIDDILLGLERAF